MAKTNCAQENSHSCDKMSTLDYLKNTTDALEELHRVKNKLIYNDGSYDAVKLIDNEINNTLNTILELSQRMKNEEYQCNCDGINSGCSSRMCNCRYTKLEGFPTHKEEELCADVNIENRNTKEFEKGIKLKENELSMLVSSLSQAESMGKNSSKDINELIEATRAELAVLEKALLYERERIKNGEAPSSYENFEKKEVKEENTTEKEEFKKAIEEHQKEFELLTDSADKMIPARRFKIDFGELGIPETMVKSFTTDFNENKLFVEIYEYADKEDKLLKKAYNVLKYKVKIPKISINRISSKNDVLVTENYFKCKLDTIHRPFLSYNSDAISTLTLIFKYGKLVIV